MTMAAMHDNAPAGLAASLAGPPSENYSGAAVEEGRMKK
jgi:hypothetical protein